MLKHQEAIRSQSTGFCGERCAAICRHSPYRCLCFWRQNQAFTHANNLDNLLISYKGLIDTNKPLFTILKPVSMRNIDCGVTSDRPIYTRLKYPSVEKPALQQHKYILPYSCTSEYYDDSDSDVEFTADSTSCL